jgi:hypothetical protein
MPGPEHSNLLSCVPVASHTIAVVPVQEDELGTHLTHPNPSLHSPGQAVVDEKPPCPSQTLASLASQTV